MNLRYMLLLERASNERYNVPALYETEECAANKERRAASQPELSEGDEAYAMSTE